MGVVVRAVSVVQWISQISGVVKQVRSKEMKPENVDHCFPIMSSAGQF